MARTKETIRILEDWLDLNEPNLSLSEYLCLKAIEFTLSRIYDYELSNSGSIHFTSNHHLKLFLLSDSKTKKGNLEKVILIDTVLGKPCMYNFLGIFKRIC